MSAGHVVPSDVLVNARAAGEVVTDLGVEGHALTAELRRLALLRKTTSRCVVPSPKLLVDPGEGRPQSREVIVVRFYHGSHDVRVKRRILTRHLDGLLIVVQTHSPSSHFRTPESCVMTFAVSPVATQSRRICANQYQRLRRVYVRRLPLGM